MNMPVFDEQHDAILYNLAAQSRANRDARRIEQAERFRAWVVGGAIIFAAGWVAGCITMLVAG